MSESNIMRVRLPASESYASSFTDYTVTSQMRERAHRRRN